LSFKKEPHPTGLAGVVDSFDRFQVKLKKKECGSIYYDVNNSCHEGASKWKVRLTVKEGQSFKWITFKANFDTVEDAKKWLHDNWEVIMKKYEVYQFEE